MRFKQGDRVTLVLRSDEWDVAVINNYIGRCGTITMCRPLAGDHRDYIVALDDGVPSSHAYVWEKDLDLEEHIIEEIPV